VIKDIDLQIYYKNFNMQYVFNIYFKLLFGF